MQQANDSANLALWLRKGILAAKAGQRDHARALLKQVLIADKRNIPAWLWLSQVVDEPGQQRLCLQTVLKLDPENEAARLRLARLRQPSSPVANEAQVIPAEDPPAPITPQSASADGCPFCQHPLPATTADCPHCGSPLVIDCPDCGTRADVEAQNCSRCHVPLGDYREGAAYFLGLAEQYRAGEQFHPALVAGESALRLAPDSASARLVVGQAQLGLGQTEEAAASLQEALTQDPALVEAALALGQLHQSQGALDEAWAALEGAIATTPDNAQLEYALGWLCMALDDPKPALEHISRATELDPTDGQAWLRLGQLHEFSNKRRQAVQAYEKAASLIPNSTVLGEQVRSRLAVLNPSLPSSMTHGWSELMRQMPGPMTLCLVAALLDAGLRPWWIGPSGWVALLLAAFGALLWASGTSSPQNPLILLIMGEEGLTSYTSRAVCGWFGVGCYFLALIIILLPIGQTIPTLPDI